MVARGFILLLVTASAGVAVVAAPQLPTQSRREQVGSGSISGVVVAADTHRPLAWAAVRVVSQTLGSTRIVVTDDAGQFTVDALAAGQFALSASKPAYLTMNYGATKPERQGTSVALVEGQAVRGLTIELPKGAAIAGTIFDANGSPFPSAAVTILRWQMVDGERQYASVKYLTTNARGQYRAFGLMPGEYLVSVDASTGEVIDATYEFVAMSESEIGSALARARQTGAPAAGAVPARARSMSYAPVFYPGTTDAARSQRVPVAAGDQKDGIDLRLEFVPTARIDGVVTGTNGPLPAGLRVSLSPTGTSILNYRYGSSGGLGPKALDAAGHFFYTGVAPGEYSLTVTPRPAPAGRGGAPPPDQPDAPFAYAAISVAGEDQQVNLALQPGMTIAGRVAFDGASPSNVTPTISLKDVHSDFLGLQHMKLQTVSADGTFRANALWPGRFVFDVTMPGAGVAIASAVSNGRDLLDAPFDLKPGDRISDLVVTMTDRPSGLSGKLVGPAGAVTSDYFVIVFSEDREFWFPNSRRIVSVRPDTQGQYTVPSLPPGRYRIAAVTDVANGEWFESAFLEALIPASMTVELAAHERKVQDLRIAR